MTVTSQLVKFPSLHQQFNSSAQMRLTPIPDTAAIRPSTAWSFLLGFWMAFFVRSQAHLCLASMESGAARNRSQPARNRSQMIQIHNAGGGVMGRGEKISGLTREPAVGFEPTACCLRIRFRVFATVHQVSWNLNSRVPTVRSRSRKSTKGYHNCCRTVAVSDTEDELVS